MKSLRFYFDPISPYAALAFARLPEALQGLSYSVDYVPVLFAAMLKAGGQKGPAEIPAKRAWTYRQIAWAAHRLQIPLQLPAAHPFNPLPLLRLAWACAPTGQTPSRWVVERVFNHVWQGGADAADAVRLAALTQDLAPAQAPEGEPVKQALREATEAAIAQGVFGVPTIAVDDKLFWGLDALDMLAAYLRDDPWFVSAAWEAAAATPVGVQRKT
ncbi:2-hydroxychromene-2-carboxylate isomerase [Paucibacter sp. APW11]|uniref:2-hydroxychromene-2-carboxylate isomerase n=1 Tax=Roseateles aquae TaxID=3077235 RepID=A0ABU3P6J1_9BURK|nr:2-hydroxychromene-2-carboxylate isomerase [Paucibacter sp. APW11]MDT8998179.1 2-hydroxychromene-2-carboxylate isomerase [Paucibacter sp. APW11]